jgi:hypothetical protein
MKRISINMTHPQIEAYKVLAEATELPFTELIRRALDYYLTHGSATLPSGEWKHGIFLGQAEHSEGR